MVFCGQCGVEQPNDKVKFCAECKAPMGGTPAPSAPALNERPPAFNPSSVQASAGPPDPKETPPGCFLVKIPDGVPPGQVVTCTVPAPYPQVSMPARVNPAPGHPARRQEGFAVGQAHHVPCADPCNALPRQAGQAATFVVPAVGIAGHEGQRRHAHRARGVGPRAAAEAAQAPS